MILSGDFLCGQCNDFCKLNFVGRGDVGGFMKWISQEKVDRSRSKVIFFYDYVIEKKVKHEKRKTKKVREKFTKMQKHKKMQC